MEMSSKSISKASFSWKLILRWFSFNIFNILSIKSNVLWIKMAVLKSTILFWAYGDEQDQTLTSLVGMANIK